MRRPGVFEPGDIVVASRFLYRHYGIYAGNGRVIHYAAENGDFGANAMVRETGLEEFAGGRECRVAAPSGGGSGATRFSPEETVVRARSRLGEKRYSLLRNNCEHFALWCARGKGKSAQVEKAACSVALISAAAVALVAGLAANSKKTAGAAFQGDDGLKVDTNADSR